MNGLMRRHLVPFAALVALVLSGCTPIQTGLVQLRVVDGLHADRLPVKGAQCAIDGPEDEELALLEGQGVSDENGRVQFAGVPVGSHTVRCRLEGEGALHGGVIRVDVPLEAGRAGLVKATLELTPVEAPRELEAVAGARSVSLRWALPQHTGESPVLAVLVRTLPGGPVLEVPGPATEVVVPGLDEGARHAFEVRVQTLHGLGPAAWTEELTLPRLPGPPESVEASPGVSSATVTWSGPDDDGGAPLRFFHVTAEPGGERRTVDAAAKSLVFTGLDVGVGYTFTVSAENVVGEGPPSKPSMPTVPTDAAHVLSVTAAPEIGGCVPLRIELAQIDGLSSELQVEIDVEGRGDFSPATLMGRVGGLSPGTYEVSWNSRRDVPARSGPVTVRATAVIGGVPGRTATTRFQVRNAPAFGAPELYSTVSNPIDVQAGDVTSDGKVDLVVLMAASGGAQIYRGLGDGRFASHVHQTGASNPDAVALALAHVDGDAHLDLVGISTRGGVVSVWLGNGDGTFQPPIIHSAPMAPRSLSVGDLDGDGDLDVVVAGETIAVLLGNGDGTLLSAVQYPFGRGPLTAYLAPLGLKGVLDLVVASRADGGVWHARGAGDGTFASPTLHPITGELGALAVGDANGDGHLDLLIGGAPRLWLLAGSEAGALSSPAPIEARAMPDHLSVVDLDGDGQAELLGSALATGKAMIWRQVKGAFVQDDDVAILGGMTALIAADVDANGMAELVAVASASSQLAVVKNLQPAFCSAGP